MRSKVVDALAAHVLVIRSYLDLQRAARSFATTGRWRKWAAQVLRLLPPGAVELIRDGDESFLRSSSWTSCLVWGTFSRVLCTACGRARFCMLESALSLVPLPLGFQSVLVNTYGSRSHRSIAMEAVFVIGRFALGAWLQCVFFRPCFSKLLVRRLRRRVLCTG